MNILETICKLDLLSMDLKSKINLKEDEKVLISDFKKGLQKINSELNNIINESEPNNISIKHNADSIKNRLPLDWIIGKTNCREINTEEYSEMLVYFIKKLNTESKFSPNSFSNDIAEKEMKEFDKCKEDINYFANTFIKIINPEKEGLRQLVLHEFQKEILKKMVDNNFNVKIQTNRKDGKTTLLTIYLLWNLIFHQEKYKKVFIGCVNKENILTIYDKLIMFNYNLPNSMMIDIDEIDSYNKQKLKIENLLFYSEIYFFNYGDMDFPYLTTNNALIILDNIEFSNLKIEEFIKNDDICERIIYTSSFKEDVNGFKTKQLPKITYYKKGTKWN